jgi:hypothetical protein
MSIVFADSFAHYDTAGQQYKYSTVGGAIVSDLAHARTGPQSLRIQSGDAPSILNFSLPPDVTQTFSFAQMLNFFSVGLAYQAEALNGKIFSVGANLNIAPAPAEQILAVQLNADGSLSLLDGSDAVIDTSAAGVITVGDFYYIRLSGDLVDAPNGAVLNVTTASFVSTDVLTVSGFAASQVFIDYLAFEGPAAPDFGYVNDLYVSDMNDSTQVPFAPNIYAEVPVADGTFLIFNWNNSTENPWQPVDAAGFPSPPHFSLVNSVPQDISQGIQWQATPRYAPDSPTHFISVTDEVYRYDSSALPAGRTLWAIHTATLYKYDDQLDAISGNLIALMIKDDDPSFVVDLFVGTTQLSPGFPYAFVMGSVETDPFTGDPWNIDDWISGRYQLGPATFSLA